MIFTDLSEIHGDRNFADDPAMQCSMARFHGEEVLVISNVKGRTTKDNVKFNFGLPNPEGYRKALRVMKIAEKFGPADLYLHRSAGRESRPGRRRARAGRSDCTQPAGDVASHVPTIATVTGEGGSGGALALAVADRVSDAGERGLFGDLTGGLRVDHVA